MIIFENLPAKARNICNMIYPDYDQIPDFMKPTEEELKMVILSVDSTAFDDTTPIVHELNCQDGIAISPIKSESDIINTYIEVREEISPEVVDSIDLLKADDTTYLSVPDVLSTRKCDDWRWDHAMIVKKNKLDAELSSDYDNMERTEVIDSASINIEVSNVAVGNEVDIGSLLSNYGFCEAGFETNDYKLHITNTIFSQEMLSKYSAEVINYFDKIVAIMILETPIVSHKYSLYSDFKLAEHAGKITTEYASGFSSIDYDRNRRMYIPEGIVDEQEIATWATYASMITRMGLEGKESKLKNINLDKRYRGWYGGCVDYDRGSFKCLVPDIKAIASCHEGFSKILTQLSGLSVDKVKLHHLIYFHLFGKMNLNGVKSLIADCKLYEYRDLNMMVDRLPPELLDKVLEELLIKNKDVLPLICLLKVFPIEYSAVVRFALIRDIKLVVSKAVITYDISMLLETPMKLSNDISVNIDSKMLFMKGAATSSVFRTISIKQLIDKGYSFEVQDREDISVHGMVILFPRMDNKTLLLLDKYTDRNQNNQQSAILMTLKKLAPDNESITILSRICGCNANILRRTLKPPIISDYYALETYQKMCNKVTSIFHVTYRVTIETLADNPCSLIPIMITTIASVASLIILLATNVKSNTDN